MPTIVHLSVQSPCTRVQYWCTEPTANHISTAHANQHAASAKTGDALNTDSRTCNTVQRSLRLHFAGTLIAAQHSEAHCWPALHTCHVTSLCPTWTASTLSFLLSSILCIQINRTQPASITFCCHQQSAVFRRNKQRPCHSCPHSMCSTEGSAAHAAQAQPRLFRRRTHQDTTA